MSNVIIAPDHKQEIVIDTEFLQYVMSINGRDICVTEPISFGLVNQDGKSYYAVSNEFNEAAARKNGWLSKHVLSQLPPPDQRRSLSDIADEVCRFIGPEETRFFYYCIEEDMTLLRQLVSPQGLMGFPRQWDIHGHNLAQDFARLGNLAHLMPPPPARPHHALDDALWAQKFLNNMRAYKPGKTPRP